ncbi:MAG: hypothetical protein WA793_06795 [Sphingorhabdus sp.]|uniref:hypothetical protein n=1 Tax=Sphingorhabdus sp. TaxID=1902408 RepID=UPI003C967690
MLNERLTVARSFAEKINETEKSFNQSISLLGQLIAEIPAARSKLGNKVPLSTGIDACERLAAAALSAAQGYRQVVEAHGHFAEDRDTLGLRTVNWGDIHECPPSAGDGASHLTVVKAA